MHQRQIDQYAVIKSINTSSSNGLIHRRQIG